MLVRVDLCQMENLGFCLTAEFLSSRQMEQFIQKITAFPIPAVPEQGMAECDIPYSRDQGSLIMTLDLVILLPGRPLTKDLV